MESLMLPGAVVFYVIVAFAWPSFQFWRHQGQSPVVFGRRAAPAQRLFGWLTRLLVLVVFGASLGRLLGGAHALGLLDAPAVLSAIGWILLAGGTLLTLVAQQQMGTSWRIGIDDRPTELVTSGLFRWVRNPVFTGLLIFLAGYACLMPAGWSVALWISTWLCLRVQIALEERHLSALHGAIYRTYAARVGRLIPLFGRLHPSKSLPIAPGG